VSPFRPPKILKPEHLVLLHSTIQKQQPGLLHLLTLFGKQQLTEDQREDLRQALIDEFIQTGLRDDSEPNERGLQLEDLIDRLEQL